MPNAQMQNPHLTLVSAWLTTSHSDVVNNMITQSMKQVCFLVLEGCLRRHCNGNALFA